jgi:hypothetical protein
MPGSRNEAKEFARMMAHEARRSTVDTLVEAARIALENSKDENEASLTFGLNLAASDSSSAAAIKFATMVAMLAIEVAQLRGVPASSPAPGQSPA